MLLISGIVTVVTFLTLNGGILMLDDSYFPFNPRLDLQAAYAPWNDYRFPGFTYWESFNYLPFIYFMSIFQAGLNLPYWLADALYISLLQSLGAVGTFLLTRYVISSGDRSIPSYGANAGGLAAGLLYSFNFYKAQYLGGEFYPSLLTVELLPLYCFLFVGFLEWDAKRRFLPVALYSVGVVLSAGIFEVPYLLWTFFALLLVTLFVVTRHKVNPKRLAIRSGVAFAIFFAAACWVMPELFVNTQVGQGVLSSTGAGPSIALTEYQAFHSISPMAFFQWGLPNLPAAGPSMFGYPLVNTIQGSPILDIGSLSIFLLISLPLLFKLRDGLRGSYLFFFSAGLCVVLVGTVNAASLVSSGSGLLSGVVFSTAEYWSLLLFSLILSLLFGISFTLILRRAVGDQWDQIPQKWSDGDAAESGPQSTAQASSGMTIDTNRVQLRPAGQEIDKSFRGVWAQGKRPEALTLIVVIISVGLFVIPQAAVSAEVWNYGTAESVTGIYHPSADLVKTGQYLSEYSDGKTILILPIAVAPSSSIENESRFLLEAEPLAAFTDSQIIYRDASFSQSSVAYPLLVLFPGAGAGNVSRYFQLLGISLIVIDRDAAPGWLDGSNNTYAGGFPYNFTGMIGSLSAATGITSGPTFGPYIIYRFAQPNPLFYPANGVSSWSVSGTNTVTPMQVYSEFTSEQLNATNTSIIDGVNSSLWGVSRATCRVSWVQVSTNDFSVSSQCLHPYYLDFNQGYSPDWKIQINGVEANIAHFVANGYANAWLMPPGNYTATVEFSIVEYQTVASSISLVGLLLTASGTLVTIAIDLIFRRTGAISRG